MKKQIIISIEDGVIKSETKGFIGNKCVEPDSFLKELGNMQVKLTEDYYKRPEPNSVSINILE